MEIKKNTSKQRIILFNFLYLLFYIAFTAFYYDDINGQNMVDMIFLFVNITINISFFIIKKIKECKKINN